MPFPFYSCSAASGSPRVPDRAAWACCLQERAPLYCSSVAAPAKERRSPLPPPARRGTRRRWARRSSCPPTIVSWTIVFPLLSKGENIAKAHIGQVAFAYDHDLFPLSALHAQAPLL